MELKKLTPEEQKELHDLALKMKEELLGSAESQESQEIADERETMSRDPDLTTTIEDLKRKISATSSMMTPHTRERARVVSEYNRRRMAGSARTLECAICRSPFISKKSWARFCSDRCKTAGKVVGMLKEIGWTVRAPWEKG